MRLFLERGYDETTVDDICAAGQVARTTFFRYFSGKSHLVWHAFDRQRELLHDRLQQAADDRPALRTVQRVVVDVARDRVTSSDLWRDRFGMYDSLPTLRAEEAARWQDWRDVIADFLVSRAGVPAHSLIPAAVAGAVQAVYVAQLRASVAAGHDGVAFVDDLDRRLGPVCTTLQSLVDLPDPA